MNGLNAERLEALLGRAAELRVAVIGDVMLDEYLTGSVTRISPEAPVPVVQVTERHVALGGAANVAANVTALGADCHLLGYVGADAAGQELRSILGAAGPGRVAAHLVERADRPTTTKTRVMARRQQVVRYDRERDDDLPADCVAELGAELARILPGVDAVILEDYNKGVLVPSLIRAALDAAAEARIPSVVDPKFRHFWEYRGATVFKPNVLELATALASPVDVHDDEQLEAARRRIGCRHLLLTLGEVGMAVGSEQSPPLRIPALAREVYDVSGAGDTVTAWVTLALAAGASIAEAATLGNYAAAIEVTKRGVATVAPDEVRELVQRMAVPDAAGD